MSDVVDLPPAVVGRLRVVCGELPEVYEERAWIGLRWRIRRRTFLHVYASDERGSAYIDLDGPAILMTFRAPPGELAALAHAGPPFFRADWGVNVVGMVLDDETDWGEVAELVTDSYRVQAPRRLAFGLKQMDEPPAASPATSPVPEADTAVRVNARRGHVWLWPRKRDRQGSMSLYLGVRMFCGSSCRIWAGC